MTHERAGQTNATASKKLSVKFALVPGLTTERVPERETVNQQVNRGASGSVRRRR